MNNNVTIEDVISYYNIIGMAIAVAVGIAGKELVFSLSNDVILPGVGLVIKNNFFKQYEFDSDKFVSTVLTFFIVLFTIILLLYIVLRPVVTKEISDTKEKNLKEEKVIENINKDLENINNILNNIQNNTSEQKEILKTKFVY